MPCEQPQQAEEVSLDQCFAKIAERVFDVMQKIEAAEEANDNLSDAKSDLETAAHVLGTRVGALLGKSETAVYAFLEGFVRRHPSEGLSDLPKMRSNMLRQVFNEVVNQ